MKKDGPKQRWICTDCAFLYLDGPYPNGDYYYRCTETPRGRKIRIHKYGLGRDVLTPKWCPVLKRGKK